MLYCSFSSFTICELSFISFNCSCLLFPIYLRTSLSVSLFADKPIIPLVISQLCDLLVEELNKLWHMYLHFSIALSNNTNSSSIFILLARLFLILIDLLNLMNSNCFWNSCLHSNAKTIIVLDIFYC
jgi:hypothetical protein